MIYINEEAKDWCDKFGIVRRENAECKNCSAAIVFDKPFAIKGYRGIAASPCSKCKHDSGMTSLVPTGDKEFSFWSRVKNWAGIK